jgi:FKBP-type peptidyl-prolyl cis-trans isomerase FklB
MKFIKLFVFIALAGVVFSSCNKITGNASIKNETDSLSYCLGVNIGSYVKSLDIPKFNDEIFASAFREAMNGKKSKISNEKAGMFLNEYFRKLQMENAQKNLKEGEEFLGKNKTRKGVTTTASGLQYEILKEGNGTKPKADDMVTVQYEGTLIDGTVFDSSYGKSKPFQTMVSGGVIPGWTEALQLMRVGSKWKIYVPARLAYGERSGGKIKPNSTLIFQIELLSIDAKPAVKQSKIKK